ncbi:hypothetical protein H5410_051433 [Solanum commersonii]|uniref:Uncharacterized protein n=1 Tax=Solanum commersonii TaxID=4109 RepID=A0A9J5X0P4_SOLCO|nr:hypothetical protein H5410_051433 [Solanum commersonii]
MHQVWFVTKAATAKEKALSVVPRQSRSCKKKMHEVLFVFIRATIAKILHHTLMSSFYRIKSFVIRNLLHQDRDVLVTLPEL